ncbi:hypothetical protein POM88_040805 [Heracleum sosnowskyi]|uniref:hAT-like transposase RNase-H fold domain-containing protein n=1 Tax=Heracleum sosnowskyi TaxID=360622 RepID=A0AAD8HDM4_9APIA|nr:hypothetical protein POM88_040805 [Heracleum sosnowskyi]
MTEIEFAVHNVRASVKYITNYVSRLQVFGDIVTQLRLLDKKLILDCGTKWNATYAMLMVAIGTDYPTSNLFLPELWHIKKILDEAQFSEDSCLKTIATNLKMKFDKYWDDCNLLISLAAILDPRNKIKFIEFSFGEIYSSDIAIRHLNEVRDCLYKLFEEYMSSHKSKIVEGQLQSESQSQSSKFIGSGKGKSRGRAQFDSMMRIVDIHPTEKSELEFFFHDEEIDPPFDALESAFSAGGRVIEPHRASLGTDIVQVLLCGADWYRAFYGLKKKGRMNTNHERLPGTYQL